jgi:colanic acid biosynthesis glycosyl transferase WcaI
MLASGRPVIATARAGTGLAHELEGVGEIIAPGDSHGLVRCLDRLLANDDLRRRLGNQGRERAKNRWSRDIILGEFEKKLNELATETVHHFPARDHKEGLFK